MTISAPTGTGGSQGRRRRRPGREFAAIGHYDRERLEALDSGHFWLSDTPTCPARDLGRLPYAHGHLRGCGSGLPANSSPSTPTSRPRERVRQARAAELLAARLRVLAPGLPRVVTGDFNAPADDPVHRGAARRGGPGGHLGRRRTARRARHLPRPPAAGPAGGERID
ncbi:endonuclease/exonuclease/phosphatase family protein [Streptomyces sp. KL116D]|uniref:endonuclease/exonuclease/phosphatase family protein n=1 Tax=Streptomyces sp. KL116D TaxID=3045152 RepID=UPI0035566265